MTINAFFAALPFFVLQNMEKKRLIATFIENLFSVQNQCLIKIKRFAKKLTYD